MLLSQFRSLYSKQTSEKSASSNAVSESPPLAVLVGSGNTAEIIDVATYKTELDNILIQKLLSLLDEYSVLLQTPQKFASTKNTDIAVSTTQPKYSEEKYEYITEYGTQILCLFTASGSCSYLSRNFERLTGQSIADSIGDSFFTLIQLDFREKLQAALTTTPTSFTLDKKEHVLRVKMRHADGKYYWYQFTIHTQNDQYVCLIENIHENIQTQNTLQKARLEAELALRSRSEFLANMSHELRTPLNAVIGFSQIMEKGIFGKIDNPQYVGYIRHIQESGHDLLAKIEDLLDIANIDSGRISLDCEEIHVNDLVKQVIKNQAHHAKAAKVSLSYVPRGNVLLFVDRVKLQHILGHLLTNAIKFNRAGGEATVEISRGEKNGIRIAVHDNGVGMSDLKCHDIRESLQHENCWTSKNGHHIGIGLALTKEFVALHGGTVEITSSSGIGTTVSVTLPRNCIRISPSRKLVVEKQLENG